jgi:hypothetical protein
MAKRTAAPAPARKRTSAPKKTNGAAMAPAPTDEDVRIRAYHRYLERGGVSGGDFDDWLEAEKDLKRNAS